MAQRPAVDVLAYLRERFAYPVYDRDYEQALEESKQVFGRFENLHLVGRNAEFRHIEVDENFASALDLVRRLVADRDS